MNLFDSGAEVKLIEKPQAGTIRVALDRVRRCPYEIESTDDSGTDGGVRTTATEEPAPADEQSPLGTQTPPNSPSATINEKALTSSSRTPTSASTTSTETTENTRNLWHNRLRPRKRPK